MGGDVFYNDLVNQGTIHGTLSTPLPPFPLFTPLPVFQSAPAGTQDILVARYKVRTLAPGDYRDITVRMDATLKLGPGIYNVRSINTEFHSEVLFQNLSSDTSEVRVANQLTTGSNGFVGPYPADPRKASQIIFYVAFATPPGALRPAAATIGGNSTLLANMYAPNGTLVIKNLTDATGAFVAKDVFVGKNVRIDLESFFTIDPPVITSFTATPGSINVGGSSTLAWSGITNATSCSINQGVGTVACTGGSQSVSPSANTTYTLTATGPGGTTTATRSVTVNQPPTIGSFTATPGTINVGQSSNLAWTTTNATTCSIDNGVGSVGCNANTNVSPAANTTYTLTATGAGGTVTSNVTVTVNQPPTIGSFTATPSTINVGQSSNLAWTTTNATTCSINNGVGSVACNGNTNVTPAANTTYTLTTTGPGGTANANASVTFNAPVITSFTSSPPHGYPFVPTSLTLTWASTNGTSATMVYRSGGCTGPPGDPDLCGAASVGTSGSATVFAIFGPAVGQIKSGDTVTLTVTGPGGSASQTINP